MNKDNLFQLFVLLQIFSCVSCEPQTTSLKEENYQYFKISCNRDTTLTSKGNVKIIIEANTFPCPNDGLISLKFAEVLNKPDMILNSLYTINEEGQFLESGGMFQLQDVTNNSRDFNKAVQLKIPTSIANGNMKMYVLNTNEETVSWTNTNKPIGLLNTQSLENGQKLFERHCTDCHSSNLRNELTGPALGNVHLFRDKEWLTQFTRNSQLLISQGDSVSICIYQAYNRSLMNSFPMLSDSDINDIYEFIANESRLQGIGLEEIKYINECEIIEEAEYNLNVNNLFVFDNDYQYLLELNAMNWWNIDYLARFDTQISPIVITLDKEYDELSIAMAFQERNIVIPFVKNKMDNTKYALWQPKEKDKIDFPLGEKVNIVAYSNGPKFKYKIMEYQPTAKNNRIEFSLDSGSETAFRKELSDL